MRGPGAPPPDRGRPSPAPGPPGEGVAGVREAVDHLFRRQSGRMVAALTRVFGLPNLDLAEDVVQETRVQALRLWPLRGIPDNPAAWLYRVARNRALDVLRRDRSLRRFAPELAAAALLGSVEPVIEGLFGESEIADDTLRLMFACCHPLLPLESQIAMTLKALAGFSTAEIGRALLAEEAAVERRLDRARLRVRDARIPLEIPDGAELPPRLEGVRAVLSRMFDEGYNASFAERPIRREVCVEAMRLVGLLAGHPAGDRPETWGLLALMCFHAARFDARVDGDGHLLMLQHQDRTRWSQPLVQEGFRALARSAWGETVGAVQLEAAIAAMHCLAPRYEATDWTAILELYDLLLTVKPSPVVALSRAIALAEVRGPAAGLAALERMAGAETLEGHYLLPATRGEFHLRLGERAEARAHLERARELTSSAAERHFLGQKLLDCG